MRFISGSITCRVELGGSDFGGCELGYLIYGVFIMIMIITDPNLPKAADVPLERAR